MNISPYNFGIFLSFILLNLSLKPKFLCLEIESKAESHNIKCIWPSIKSTSMSDLIWQLPLVVISDHFTLSYFLMTQIFSLNALVRV
jgi:hypothetical protein